MYTYLSAAEGIYLENSTLTRFSVDCYPYICIVSFDNNTLVIFVALNSKPGDFR